MDHVFQTFRDRGHLDYGENVTEAQHALQCATLARADGEPAEIVTACLLHDFGHLVHDLGQDIAKKGIDARHESIGANRLASLFVEEDRRTGAPPRRCQTLPLLEKSGVL